MTPLWPATGVHLLQPDAAGWLPPTPAWWQQWLQQPELALVADSCPAEHRLHALLGAEPLAPVPAPLLAAVADAGVRDNHRLFLALRDGVQVADTLEAFYAGLFRQGAIGLPPLFIDLLVRAMLVHLLGDASRAWEAHAAELLFRPQRINLQAGRVLAADSATVDRLGDAGGFGALGRLLAETQVPLRSADLQVLNADNAADYCHDRRHDGAERHRSPTGRRA